MTTLGAYDGSAGVLVDTNVWVDCIDEESPWHDRAIDLLQQCSEQAPLHVNIIIYTELLVPQPDVQLLDAMLDVYEAVRSPLPWSCAARLRELFRSIEAGAAHDLARLPTSTSARMRPSPICRS